MWDDLRFVLAVARHGTLVGAAKALTVDPTTVARRVRALEERNGVALFTRLKHGATLTSAGEQSVRAAVAMERLYDQLDASIHGLDSRLEGVVRVSSTDMIYHYLLPKVRDFRREYNGVQLEFSSSYSKVSLTQRHADIALRVSPKVPEHLIAHRCTEVFFAVYGAGGLIEASMEWTKLPWVDWDPRVTRATSRVIQEHAPDAPVVARVDATADMIDLVEGGVGLSVLPCFLGDPNPRLSRVGDYMSGGTWLWVLTQPELRRTARVRAFAEWVQDLLVGDRELFEGRALAATQSDDRVTDLD